jgi:hypothetical protein
VAVAARAEGEHDRGRHRRRRRERRAQAQALPSRPAHGERGGGQLGSEARVKALRHGLWERLLAELGEGTSHALQLVAGDVVLEAGVVHVR